MTKRLTPLQESIAWIDEKTKGLDPTRNIAVETMLLVREYLTTMLSKEQQLLSEAWEAGIESFCWDSGSEFVDTKPMNKKEFLSQFNQ